jgi:hypothetical protein
MKRNVLLSLVLVAALLLAACTPDSPVLGTGFTVAATNVYGAEAIPVAYDVYAQLWAILSPESAEGFDADFVMSMVMDTLMDGESMGSTQSTSTGNMRANFDGNTSQSATIMETVMEMEMLDEPITMTMEMFMETVEDEITFFRMLMDSEVFEDPMMTDMLDSIPSMTIPEITMDAILYAEVVEVGDETHISFNLDANFMSDFVDEVIGSMLGDMMATMGVDMSMDIDYISFVVELDGENNLSRLLMDMDVSMGMEMDLGLGDPMEFLITITSTTIYTYNYIGNVTITMPE